MLATIAVWFLEAKPEVHEDCSHQKEIALDTETGNHGGITRPQEQQDSFFQVSRQLASPGTVNEGVFKDTKPWIRFIFIQHAFGGGVVLKFLHMTKNIFSDPGWAQW